MHKQHKRHIDKKTGVHVLCECEACREKTRQLAELSLRSLHGVSDEFVEALAEHRQRVLKAEQDDEAEQARRTRPER
jgi:hypothetical protein